MRVEQRQTALGFGFCRGFICFVILCLVPLLETAQAQTGSSAIIVRSIQVDGNQRVERETVLSYMAIRPGDPYQESQVDQSLKTLFATGLFSDVRIQLSGVDLVVTVSENPIINRVIFEGNQRLNDDRLREEVEVRPRAVFTRAKVQADVQRVIEVYRRSGRFAATVDPKVVRLEQNRVDLVFEITEGPITNIGRISFVGNERYSDAKLRRTISTRQSRWYAFLRSSDIYDPDRVAFDQELLRQFYLSRGYADFKVVSAAAELSPDNSTFLITFTVDEGERYTFGAPSVETTLTDVKPEVLEAAIPIKEGEIYNAEEVDSS
ncbi:MAG: POTRA domain-containing protein, partial [Pseudomonadota bacterium]